MSGNKRWSLASILLVFVAFSAYFTAALSQSPAGSSRFGAGTSTSSSTAGSRVSTRSAGSGGSSSWGAGKGSFGYSAQSGGIWRDGSTLSPSLVAAHGKAEARSSPQAPLSSGGIATTRSSGQKATGVRGNAASGTARSSRPGLSGGTVRKTSSFGHSARRSRGRAGSTGTKAKNVKSRETSGLATSLGRPGLLKAPGARSSLHKGLEPQTRR
jgi:hypothetical protein